MPRRIETKEEILAAMEKTPLLASVPLNERHQWLKGFVDKDNGKHSGPMIRLFAYKPGEILLRENEWGGNNFLILVEGALNVFMKDPTSGVENKVNEIRPGESFGEMSLFAGVPRIASVVSSAPSNSTQLESLVLEIARPAFRGMEKKAAQFIEQLGQIYELRGLDTAIERIRQATDAAFTQAQLDLLQEISSFRVFGRSHLLCEQGQQIDKVFLINNGWVRRSRDLARVDDATGWARLASESVDLDFLGGGNFLGFEGLSAPSPTVWKYSGTV